MEAFLYCWTDKLTNMLYLGAHKGAETDGYVCSSKLMLAEYQKRPENFSRQIIARGSWEDIISLETAMLRSVDAAKNENFYNKNNNDWPVKKNLKHTALTKKKIGEAQKKSREAKPRKHTDETKRKMSESMKGKKHKPYYGRPVKEATKQKIRESLTGRKESMEVREKKRAARLRYLENRGK